MLITLLATASPAAGQDSDGDGLEDAQDNCTRRANGPAPSGPQRLAQRDTDLDGFGNPCDADLNNDGVPRAAADLVTLLRAFGSRIGDAGYDPNADMDGDGAVGEADFSLYATTTLGPSGLGCAGTRPCPAQNVLILIADDVGVDKIGSYRTAPDPPRTPEIDSLAAAGVRFTRAWSNPVCSPTRATALTGLYSFRTGLGRAVPGDNPGAFRVDPAAPSIARHLRDAGYRTAAFGKWHLSSFCVSDRTPSGGCGDHYDLDHPLEMGFDHFEGTGNLRDYCEWPKVGVVRNPDGSPNVFENRSSTTYATTATVETATAWIGGASEPWLVWVGFNAAHFPLHRADASDPCPMSSGGLSDADQYDSMVERLDLEIGRLLAGIPAGVRSRTTVIFFGDNGTSRYGVEAPFDASRAKGTLYQGGVNVPFLVSGRTVTARAGGEESAALVNTTDIFATVAQLSGLALPAEVRDSVSFAEHLSDPGRRSSRATAYAERFASAGPGPHAEHERAIRDDRYKLIRLEGVGFEGYDLAGDARFESEDLIPAASQVQRDAFYCLAETMSALQQEPWTFDDFDGDGVPNDVDNCSVLPNPSQCDSRPEAGLDPGNHCDGDFDDSGTVDVPDLLALLRHFGVRLGDPGFDPDFDMNCDASIDALDQDLLRLESRPGPAGCGGAIPCPASAPRCPQP